MIRLLVAALLALLAPPLAAAPRPAGLVRVRLETAEGAIVLALEAKRAPKTTANFLAYVDQHRFDGTSFYRSARSRRDPSLGFVQGGVQHSYKRLLPPVAHEPTSRTGLTHADGTISMARNAPGTAMGDFIITLGPIPSMDARGDFPGYAAFGHVVEGKAVLRRILAGATIANAGSGVMRNQFLARPVRIVRAVRVR